jgi:hypothetical protein
MGHLATMLWNVLRHYAGLAAIFKLSLEIGGCGCQGLEKADALALAA